MLLSREITIYCWGFRSVMRREQHWSFRNGLERSTRPGSEEQERTDNGDRDTPYNDVDEQPRNITSQWWLKFNALNCEQRIIVERIIAEHNFDDEIINVADKEIKEVLKYYQIKRDK